MRSAAPKAPLPVREGDPALQFSDFLLGRVARVALDERGLQRLLELRLTCLELGHELVDECRQIGPDSRVTAA